MNRNSKLLRKSLAVAGAVTLSLSMCSPVLAADVSATGNKLTITDVSYGDERAVTSTGKASSVSSVTYTLDGKSYTKTAEDGKVLTLVVDGQQEDLTVGSSYDVDGGYNIAETKVYKSGGPSAPPWNGPDAVKSIYNFRQALLVNDGKIVEDGSVLDAISGDYSDTEANNVTVKSNGAHFNGIYVTGNSKYAINKANVTANGDGGDDFSGWGSAVMADQNTDVTINDSYINTAGTIRTAIWVGDSSKTTVNNSVIYAQETNDDYSTYSELVPSMMKRVPFALGMEGTISMIISTGWGALSTDSGTSYNNTGTYALQVNNSVSGIGTVEVAQAAKKYTATQTVNGVTYGYTMGGSGYVTYADSGVWNKYSNVRFYSPDYVQILASGESSSIYDDSYMYSDRIAFMTQQAGGGTLTLKDSDVDTKDALMQIKSGKANKGYSHLVVDNTDVDFSGDSKRTDDGILVELVESDDAGNPGVTSYTINDVGEDAIPTGKEIDDSSATFKNGAYTGDIWNSIYNNKQALDVSLENAQLTGTVSSSVAVHIDPETGDVVENGTVLQAYTGSESGNHANYLADDGTGTTGDYMTIGSFSHTAHKTINNPVNLDVDKDSTWTVTGDSYLNTLDLAAEDCITAADPETVYTTALTVGDVAYEYGTYTINNVTIKVEASDIVIPDTGIAAEGQTFVNIPYVFYVENEDGTYNSAAAKVATLNTPSGTVLFSVDVQDGYEIVSTTPTNGQIDPSTDFAEYPYVLSSTGGPMDQMRVVIKVRAKGATPALDGLAMAEDGNWYLYQNGTVASGYNGLAANEYGWFKVTNGKVDFDYTGLAANENGWFKVTNGKVDFNYTGLAANEYGWFMVVGGKVDFGYTGLASNENGWFMVIGGKVNFDYNGLAANQYGWFKVTNGKVDFGYTGQASNEYGTWNVVGGKVVF